MADEGCEAERAAGALEAQDAGSCRMAPDGAERALDVVVCPELDSSGSVWAAGGAVDGVVRQGGNALVCETRFLQPYKLIMLFVKEVS